MIRARFHTNSEDFRPVNWPVKHPYWCSGSGDGFWVMIAYADDEAEILKNWPEATDIESEEVRGYEFSDRFRRPDWLMR